MRGRVLAPHKLREMLYLWRATVRMDNATLIKVLLHETLTPLVDVLRAPLEGMDAPQRPQHGREGARHGVPCVG